MTKVSVAASLAMLSVAQIVTAQTPPAPAPSPCASAQFREFDFWVGRWDVFGPQGKKVGTSMIEKVYGCGVRENWMPSSGAEGGSLNIYVPDKKLWEQFWIDGRGSRAHFSGGWNGEAMVLTGRWGGPLTRMTYTPNKDGSVRQFGEQSTDEGKNWVTSFDLIYRPRQ